VADRDLLHRAATCYRRAGYPEQAAECFRLAAMYRESAAVWESLGALGEAAADLARAGLLVRAAWLLVHRLGDPAQARELLGGAPDGGPDRDPEFVRRLVLARCDVADAGGTATASALAVLDDVMDELAEPDRFSLHQDVEDHAVALAETIGRPDLVALVFAAAVRGNRPGAARRWDAWSLRELGMPVVLPAGTSAAIR
jgi:hypothetical protein